MLLTRKSQSALWWTITEQKPESEVRSFLFFAFYIFIYQTF